MKSRRLLNIVMALITLSSCTATKFLPEGERFYEGEEFLFLEDSIPVNKKRLALELERIIEPEPNSKIFGMRPGAWFYYKTKNLKKEKGLKYWMKKNLAKKPTLQSDVKLEQMASRIEGYLRNEGYFQTKASSSMDKRKNTATAKYSVKTGPAYTIRNIIYPETVDAYESLMENIKNESILTESSRYQLKKLREEQKRIEDCLEDHGFYYFDDNYLIYLADSTIGNNQIDLTLSLSEDTPEQAKRIFTFSNVEISPDYSISNDTLRTQNDIEVHDSYTFINNDDYIRPDILTETVVFKKGDIYSEQAETKTRERLMALGTYKFVNLKFKRTDSSRLKSEIFLTPLPQKSIRLDLQAISKSNNFVGPSFSTSFQNRNAFRGAELFELKLNTSYEVQVGGQNNPPLTAYELNLEGSVTIPRLITPFNIDYRSLRFIPKTRISLGTRLQQRVNVFQINSFEGRYGFLWQESYTKRHQLYPINVSFVQLSNTSEAFNERLAIDPNLDRSLDDQFILGALYEYTFSSKSAKDAESKRHHFYFNGILDISGNLAYAAQSLVGAESSNEEKITYSQYSKVQLDFRYFKKIGADKELASRLLLGAANAYGNSSEVPFIKQFSSGGSNSVRAFRARSLGPGAYINNETGDLVIDETGDVKIEANIEYRTPLIGVLETALFVDAGNIWLWDGRNTKPDGEFDKNFLEDIAIGTGVGLRLDFSFFLLRFDLAFPLRKPLPGGLKWVFDEIDPLDSDWRGNNLLLNIAIGYPF